MRNPAITQLKGFLVFLVVFGHVIEGFSSSIAKDWLYNFIYSFHMPAFVAISGFLFKAETAPSKLVKTILIPFVVYNVIFEISSFTSFGRFTHNFYGGAPMVSIGSLHLEAFNTRISDSSVAPAGIAWLSLPFPYFQCRWIPILAR